MAESLVDLVLRVPEQQQVQFLAATIAYVGQAIPGKDSGILRVTATRCNDAGRREDTDSWQLRSNSRAVKGGEDFLFGEVNVQRCRERVHGDLCPWAQAIAPIFLIQFAWQTGERALGSGSDHRWRECC
jgi:hypothetical protein